MPGWPPLPIGLGATQMIKDLRAMNAQIYGTIFASSGVISGDVTIEGSFIGNDYLSTNWDGANPANLASAIDPTATEGFYIDASAGAMQLSNHMWVGRAGTSGYMALNHPSYSALDIVWDVTAADHVARISVGTSFVDPDYYSFMQLDPPGFTTYDEGYLLLTGWDNQDGAAEIGIDVNTHITVGHLDSGNVGSLIDGVLYMADNGTATAPVIAWDIDENLGIYRVAADTLGITTGGTLRVSIDSGGVHSTIAGSGGIDQFDAYNSDNATGRIAATRYRTGSGWDVMWGTIQSTHYLAAMSATGTVVWGLGADYARGAAGTAAAPSWSFLLDTNTGFYNGSADAIYASAGGTARGYWYTDGLHLLSGNTFFLDGGGVGVTKLDESWGMRANGNASHPFRVNTNAAFTLGEPTGGSSYTGGYFYQTGFPTTGTAANFTWLVATGAIYYAARFTSSKRYKKHISYNVDRLADIELKPASFWRDDDDGWFLGFIAEDLAEEDYRLGVYTQEDRDQERDGIDPKRPVQVENFDTSAVLAVLAAKVNRLERQVKELQNGVH